MKCSILSLSCAAMLLKNKTVHEGKDGGKPYSAGPVCGKDPEIRSRGGLAVPRARVRHLPGARGKIAEAGCFLWGERGGKEGVLLPAGGGSAGPRLACGLRGKNRLFRGKRGGRREKTAGRGKRCGRKQGKTCGMTEKKEKRRENRGGRGRGRGTLRMFPEKRRGKEGGKGKTLRNAKNAAGRGRRGKKAGRKLWPLGENRRFSGKERCGKRGKKQRREGGGEGGKNGVNPAE